MYADSEELLMDLEDEGCNRDEDERCKKLIEFRKELALESALQKKLTGYVHFYLHIVRSR